ncbi:hypothetical protein HDU79_010152 [Rhizoclosmatium sp. JEL0117]|nr:hypothetical protein HDU79_010152 [Rhizoclosmatium sp. JEL0117]
MVQSPMASPKTQTYVLLAACVPEVMTEFMLRPLIPFIVRMLCADLPVGEKETQIGIKSGLLAGVFFLPTLATNVLWGAASDSMGRKPILLLNLLVSGLATFILGLSTSSFFITMLCRFLAGVFGANSTVAKGALGDIHQDEVGRSWAYTLHGLLYAISGFLGPTIGGILVNGATWEKGTLPILGVAIFLAVSSIIAWFSTTILFRETRCRVVEHDSDNEETVTSASSATESNRRRKENFFMAALKSRQLMIAILLYVLISFCTMSWASTFPLLFSAPVENGGLGMSATDTSFAMSIPFSVRLVFQIVAVQWVVTRFGPFRSYIFGMAAILPVTIGLGLLGGSTSVSWFWISIWMGLSGIIESVVFLSTMILICESVAPSSLGSAFGLSSTGAALANTIAPPITGRMWVFASVTMQAPWMAFLLIQITAVVSLVIAVWASKRRAEAVADDENIRLMD